MSVVRRPHGAVLPVVYLYLALGGAASTAAQTPPLTLQAVLARSLAHPTMRAAQESVEQANADVAVVSVLPNPTATGEVALLPLSRRYTPEEPGGPTEVSGTVSYPLDWLLFGKRAAAIGSAEAGVHVASAEYDNTIRQRVLETTIAFWTAVESNALHDVSVETVDDLARTETAIEKAVAGGGRPPVELHRVRLELQAARRDERTARADAAAARAALAALIDMDPQNPSWSLAGTLDAPMLVRAAGIDEAVSLALPQRADLRALEQQVQKTKQDERLEAANGRPETAISVGVARQLQESIGAPDVTAWGVSLDVTLPLFDRNQGNRRRARSATIQAGHTLAAARLDLRAEIIQAAEALNAAFDNATELGRTSLELAAQVRDSLRKAFDAGGRPLVDVLDAQRSYRETYQDYVRSRADYWRALARYDATLGTRITR